MQYFSFFNKAITKIKLLNRRLECRGNRSSRFSSGKYTKIFEIGRFEQKQYFILAGLQKRA